MRTMKKSTLKFFATLVATILIYDAAALPLAHAASIATQTSPSTNSSFATSRLSQISARAAKKSTAFRVPASIGSIVETYAPASAGRLVYHLQDVHNHIPAQINLSQIVLALEQHAAQQGKKLVIALEGLTTTIDSDKLSRIPNQKNKEDVASGLLRAGYLFGEEYAAIMSAPGRIKLIGIEDADLYKKNRQARGTTKVIRGRMLSVVRETKAQLQKLVPHNFNSLLTRLETKRTAVEEGTFPLTDYVSFLKGIDGETIRRHPNLARLASLSAQEAGIDFDKVEEEGRLLVQEAMVGKSDDAMDQLLADAEALKDGRLSPLSYYSILLGQSKKSHPLIEQYVSYLRASEAIDADALFDEVLVAEAEIAKKLIRHPLALELYEHLRWMERQERFFSLNMIPQEWAIQQHTSMADIDKQFAVIRKFVAEQVGDLGYTFQVPMIKAQDLKAAFDGAASFYQAAEDRDAKLVSNLENVLNSDEGRNAVVAFITGGFHTPGITKLLRSKNYAYQVVRPQLETEVELSQEINYPAHKVNYTKGTPAEGLPAAAGLPSGDQVLEQALGDPAQAAKATEQLDQLNKANDAALEGTQAQVSPDTQTDPAAPASGAQSVADSALEKLKDANKDVTGGGTTTEAMGLSRMGAFIRVLFWGSVYLGAKGVASVSGIAARISPSAAVQRAVTFGILALAAILAIVALAPALTLGTAVVSVLGFSVFGIGLIQTGSFNLSSKQPVVYQTSAASDAIPAVAAQQIDDTTEKMIGVLNNFNIKTQVANVSGAHNVTVEVSAQWGDDVVAKAEEFARIRRQISDRFNKEIDVDTVLHGSGDTDISAMAAALTAKLGGQKVTASPVASGEGVTAREILEKGGVPATNINENNTFAVVDKGVAPQGARLLAMANADPRVQAVVAALAPVFGDQTLELLQQLAAVSKLDIQSGEFLKRLMAAITYA